MARKSQHTFSKRQREQKKVEKAAQKLARRLERKDPELPAESQENAPSPDEGEGASDS